jgi:hypothetical protein
MSSLSPTYWLWIETEAGLVLKNEECHEIEFQLNYITQVQQNVLIVDY